MKLTIGLVTCNREETTNRFIDSLYKYNDLDFEFILIDNSNAYGNDYTYHHNDKINHIKIDEPIGLTKSCNMIMDMCKTKYLFLFHDDMYFNKYNVIKRTIEDLEKYSYNILTLVLKDNQQPRWAGKVWSFAYGNDGRVMIYRSLLDIATCRKLGITNITVHEGEPAMLIDMESIGDLRWDEHYKWKGDQQAFFYRCYIRNLKVGSKVDDYIVHERKTYKNNDTISLVKGNYGIWDREYMIKEYGVQII